MAYIPPIPPDLLRKYTDGTPSKPLAQFPPNLAGSLTSELSKKMWQWLLTNYVWPQIQERTVYEPLWDKLLNMARVTIPYRDLFQNTQQDPSKAKQAADQSNRDKARVSDSVVHDAIQRLTDITSFIAFKEGLPAQFAVPDYIKHPLETKEYRPLADRIQGGNALLQWNSGNFNLKRNSTIVYRHHYTYGCAFVLSDFRFKVDVFNQQNNLGQMVEQPEITEIGTTFEPVSIRKLWFNWRLPVYDMNSQPCPFLFEETPRFAVMQNVYHPQQNPFGYENLDKLSRGQFIYSGPEMQSIVTALQQKIASGSQTGATSQSLAQILKPEHSVEAKWLLFPVMPYDPATGEFEFRADGKTPVPSKRFVMETWGTNVTGSQVIIRLQQNYYPRNMLPLYASCHMPDLDSGAYAPAVGELLENHYNEIILCMEQYLQNKDLLNDPPAWVQVSSPGQEQDFNQKGAKIKVNGPNDFGWAKIPDATQSTVSMLTHLRDQAQTTGKTVDAILGKAMGSRTSASEANNAFESSMSAITTDIDLLSCDIHGEGYAKRVWYYTATWFDPDLLEAITGQFGFAMKPEDMWINIGLKTNAGSTYVEKIVRQQNIRYVLESSRGEPGLDRPLLWTELLEAMGFDAGRIVDDGGREQQIQFATLQAAETYMGRPVIVDPDQDHALAIRVKTAFIKDQRSVWNSSPEFAKNSPALISQIQQHQYFLQLQQQMMLVQQQMQVAQAQLKIHQTSPVPSESPAGTGPSSSPVAQRAGQIAQQGAGAQ